MARRNASPYGAARRRIRRERTLEPAAVAGRHCSVYSTQRRWTSGRCLHANYSVNAILQSFMLCRKRDRCAV